MDYVVVWQHVISSPWWCICCVLCRVSWTWYNMLPHNRIFHTDVLLPI